MTTDPAPRARSTDSVAACAAWSPIVAREGFDGPLPVEAADAGVLLAPKRTGGQIDHGLIVDVGHPDLHVLGKIGRRGLGRP
jgi:hypothetical protein